MAVWLTMSMSHVGQGSSANTAEIYVSVNVHWDAKHYNREGGALSVTVDGSTYNYSVPFNAGETSSGSQSLYSAYWTVSHTSSRTVYGYATFQATNATTATPASAEVYLSGSGSGTGGGSSGGGSDEDDEDDGGGNSGSGSGSGGSSSDSESYFSLDFKLSGQCFIKLYEGDTFVKNIYGSQTVRLRTYMGSTYALELVVATGYKISSFSVSGWSYADTGFVRIDPNSNDTYPVIASVVLEFDYSDIVDEGKWVIGDCYDTNDPPLVGEESPDGSRYILVKQAEGTKITITRVYTEAGAYLGELVDGELFQDDYGTWYKYKVYKWDYFTIEAEALPGYNIDTHSIYGQTFNFCASGITYGTLYDLDGGWRWGTSSGAAKIARIYTTATKIDGSGKDYGSGSGTLYFYGAEYGAQYAVSFAYSDNKFYVTSVKVKVTKSGLSSTIFDLFVKINDVVIHSGEKSVYNIPLDWYDLNIFGWTSITDEVKITFFGTSEYINYLDNIASPTVQTISIQYDTDGDSGDDDPDDNTGLDEYYLILCDTVGASCTINRTYTYHEDAPVGNLLPDFTEDSNGDVLKYYRIWPYDRFSIHIEAESGYELYTYVFGEYQFEYNLLGMSYYTSDNVWVFDNPQDDHPVLYYEATKIAQNINNGVMIESEFGSDEYTPYIYTEVPSGQANTVYASCEVVGCRCGNGYITNGNIDYDSFGDNYSLDTYSFWGVRGGILGYLYILKFTTPYFEDYANSISIYIKTSGKAMSSSDNNTLMNYAISTSDQNYDRYVVTIGVPYDKYMVSNGTFNEVLDGISIIEDTNVRLQPNTDYYLFVWDTNSEGEWTSIYSAINHQVVVGYPEYEMAYQYVPYSVYYDTGYSWELLV